MVGRGDVGHPKDLSRRRQEDSTEHAVVKSRDQEQGRDQSGRFHSIFASQAAAESRYCCSKPARRRSVNSWL